MSVVPSSTTNVDAEVNTGAVVSTTFTTCETSAELPEASVAE